MESSRDQLLELLRRAPATVDELVPALGMTRNGVRAHLSVLERDGLVRRAGVRREERPGKPPVIYAITELAELRYSRAYAPAFAATVAVLAEGLPQPELHALFSKAGRRLAETVPATGERDAVRAADALLRSLGAATTVSEAGGRGAVISGAACPLADVVRHTPEGCELVRSLLAERTGADVAMQCEHGASPRCRFAVD
jgi:predicted ArsR family transcriptional regulator